MRRFALNLAALLSLAGAQAFGSIVYQNTTTDTLDTLPYGANIFTQIGDQIHLGGTDRLATRATVQFYNGIFGGGTFDATLRLFNVGPNAGNPVGSQIGPSILLTGITAASLNSFNVVFNLLPVVLPNDLVFTISVSNQSAGVDIVGLNMFEPPGIGSSDNSFSIANDGTNFIQVPTPMPENVFLQLEATPEPATIGLTGSFLLGLALFRRRASRSAGR